MKDDLILERAKAEAEKQGRALLASLRKGTYKPAADKTMVWVASEAVDRQTAQAAPQVVRKIFAMPKPTDGELYEGVALNDEFVVIELQKVENKPIEALAKDEAAQTKQKQLAEELKNIRTNRLLDLFLEELRDGADIFYAPSLVKDETAS